MLGGEINSSYPTLLLKKSQPSGNDLGSFRKAVPLGGPSNHGELRCRGRVARGSRGAALPPLEGSSGRRAHHRVLRRHLGSWGSSFSSTPRCVRAPEGEPRLAVSPRSGVSSGLLRGEAWRMMRG